MDTNNWFLIILLSLRHSLSLLIYSQRLFSPPVVHTAFSKAMPQSQGPFYHPSVNFWRFLRHFRYLFFFFFFFFLKKNDKYIIPSQLCYNSHSQLKWSPLLCFGVVSLLCGVSVLIISYELYLIVSELCQSCTKGLYPNHLPFF
jgi:hypothetical protein